MDFEVLIMGSDANAYYMARCCHEAYNKKAHLIGAYYRAFTKYSKLQYNPECEFAHIMPDYFNGVPKIFFKEEK